MYKLIIRPLLFLIDPEFIHQFVFSLLKIKSKVLGFHRLTRRMFTVSHPSLEKKILGLTFKNPVGLAAGFDKDARLVDELADLGFGFIEIGTLTPLAQAGNPRPRLFRLQKDFALINRMGFNNEGVMAAVERLKKRKSEVIVGGNIGKNKDTPNDQAFEDYTYCFEALYPYVDYFVVNVSSPNTPGLRDLQEKEPLRKLLEHVRRLNQLKEKKKPLLVKIAPDLTVEQLDDVITILKATKMDGVIATNTTISREDLNTSAEKIAQIGAGGLSGKPLGEQSDAVIAYLRREMGKDFPIIGVGGVFSPGDVLRKLKAGADLVQIYTGFIYEGPSIVSKINNVLIKEAAKR